MTYRVFGRWVAIADKRAVGAGVDAQGVARSAAQWMAGRAWARREEMSAGGATVEESLKEAVGRYHGPKLAGQPEGGGGARGPIIGMDVGEREGARKGERERQRETELV